MHRSPIRWQQGSAQHTHTHIHTHTHTHQHTHTQTHTHKHTQTHTHTQAHKHTHTHRQAQRHTHTQTHIHEHTHAHVHAHIQVPWMLEWAEEDHCRSCTLKGDKHRQSGAGGLRGSETTTSRQARAFKRKKRCASIPTKIQSPRTTIEHQQT